ncbi:MAG: DPP IV N-terminal domain-containing protein, partial [Flavobacteriaceae bacterium]|nr:DPP IV N-terminal domain-containing protein [Flavobacteriaceae bacterium]
MLFLFTTLVSNSQEQLTLEEIWNFKFYPSYMHSLNSMNGDYYSLLNRTRNGVSIDKYSYKTLQKVETILDSKDLEIPYFETYSFNADETKLLLGFNLKPVYRHSTKGSYIVYDLKTKKTSVLQSEEVQEPTFSPDGKKIAFVVRNNLYVKNLETGKQIQITEDGKINHIINGVTDWVYEEEF